jgi:hypothetical protein
MRNINGLGQTRMPVRNMSEPLPVAALAPSAKEIPYDYVARFILAGEWGNRIEDVINISIEGAFVAAAIGYSFIPANPPPPLELGPIELNPPIPVAAVAPTTTTLFEIIAGTIADNLNLSGADRSATVNQIGTLIQTLRRCLQVQLCGIDFKYSIVDSGTGRELQNQPIHNIAGLGKADGDRPFRPFAKPMVFLPRSTIRITVEEISVGDLYKGSELYIVLHGYKMLGYGTALP